MHLSFLHSPPCNLPLYSTILSSVKKDCLCSCKKKNCLLMNKCKTGVLFPRICWIRTRRFRFAEKQEQERQLYFLFSSQFLVAGSKLVWRLARRRIKVQLNIARMFYQESKLSGTRLISIHGTSFWNWFLELFNYSNDCWVPPWLAATVVLPREIL